MLRDGELGIVELATQEKVSPSILTRVLRLAFLSPAVVDAILAGTLRAGASAKTVTLGAINPACCVKQIGHRSRRVRSGHWFAIGSGVI